MILGLSWLVAASFLSLPLSSHGITPVCLYPDFLLLIRTPYRLDENVPKASSQLDYIYKNYCHIRPYSEVLGGRTSTYLWGWVGEEII